MGKMIPGQMDLLQLLHETEKGMPSREKEKMVMVEKAANLRLMCDYAVSCSYLDVVLLICMLHDYVNMLDGTRADDIQYQAYYREKFLKMAGRLEGQIGYDYGKQLEKCRKKMDAEKKNDDIGEDALALAVKYGRRNGKKGGRKGEDGNAGTSGEKEMV